MARDHPREACLWMALLGARGVTVAAGGEETWIPQTNGVASCRRWGARNNSREGGRIPSSPPATMGGRLWMTPTSGVRTMPTCKSHSPRSREPSTSTASALTRRRHASYAARKTRRRFTIGGQWVQPETGDAALTVLGSPVSFQGGPPQLAAEMGARARAAWGKNKDLLTAKTALKRRLQLRQSNTQQLQQVRCMIGGGGEHRGRHGRTGTPERSEWPGYTSSSRTKSSVGPRTYCGPSGGSGGTSLERGTSRSTCSCGGGCSGGDNSNNCRQNEVPGMQQDSTAA